jgi:serine/threonine protein kinase
VTVKRLADPLKFLMEFKALRKTTLLDHPHLGTFLHAFVTEDKGETHFNIVFPFAIGTLQGLFAGDFDESPLIQTAPTLWRQFEGLASAVAFLHDHIKMEHGDISPSNVLVCQGQSQELTLKLTGCIGETRYLGDPELCGYIERDGWRIWKQDVADGESAFLYDSPEVRYLVTWFGQFHEIFSNRNDIYQLGRLFVELMTFLVFGSRGIKELEEWVTTTVRVGEETFLHTSMEDDRPFFGLKIEAHNWLRKLSAAEPRAAEIEPLILQMLSHNTKRPSAVEALKSLLQVIPPLLIAFLPFSFSNANFRDLDPVIVEYRHCATILRRHESRRNHAAISRKQAILAGPKPNGC